MRIHTMANKALACFLTRPLLMSAMSTGMEISSDSEAANENKTTYFKAYSKADYETVSPDFTLKVNGQPVDTVAYFEYKDGVYRYSYAHLAYEGIANFEIKNLHGDITEYNLSPHSYEIEASLTGDTLTFSLEQKESRYLILRTWVNNVRYELIIACDPQIDYGLEELKKGNFVNVVDDLGFDNSGATKLSEANGGSAKGQLQDAINQLSSQGGGTLYFPSGTYSFVYMDAKDNVTIYLDEGAYLRGTGDRTDYTWNDKGANGIQGRRLINLGNSRNFTLIGPGTIDGNIIALSYHTKTTTPNGEPVPSGPYKEGWYPDGWNDYRTGLIDADGASKVVLKGITVKETTGWTFNICNSTNVKITNVKMLNDYEIVHSDGYDLVTCQDVVIDECLGVCGDDVFCPKAANSNRVMSDYQITDGVAYALGGAGCKIGVQSNAKTTRIVFDNIDVVQGYRAFCIAHDEGQGEWSKIVFRNIRTEEIWIEGEPDSNGQYRPAAFILWTLGGGQGLVHDVTVENCSIEDTKGLRGIIQGESASGRLYNIAIKNLSIDGMTINEDNYRSKIDVGNNVSKLTFENDSLKLTDTVRYEAEVSRDRTGDCDAVQAAGASSGWATGFISKTSKVTLNVFAATAGEREIEVFYCTRGSSQLVIEVNNGAETTYTCQGTDANATSPNTIKCTAKLKRGMNAITFSGTSEARNSAPKLDKIEVATLNVEEKQAVTRLIADIDALPDAVSATAANGEAVVSIINRYNELRDDEKVFINNIAKLTAVSNAMILAGVSVPEYIAITPNDGPAPEARVEAPPIIVESPKKTSIGVWIGAIAGVGVLVAGAVGLGVYLGKKKKKSQ